MAVGLTKGRGWLGCRTFRHVSRTCTAARSRTRSPEPKWSTTRSICNTRGRWPSLPRVLQSRVGDTHRDTTQRLEPWRSYLGGPVHVGMFERYVFEPSGMTEVRWSGRPLLGSGLITTPEQVGISPDPCLICGSLTGARGSSTANFSRRTSTVDWFLSRPGGIWNAPTTPTPS